MRWVVVVVAAATTATVAVVTYWLVSVKLKEDPISRINNIARFWSFAYTLDNIVFISTPPPSPYYLIFIFYIFSNGLHVYSLRITRITTTIFIHNNQLIECQLQRSTDYKWCVSKYVIDERKKSGFNGKIVIKKTTTAKLIININTANNKWKP